MEITLLGLLLIPLGVIFLFLPSKYLFFSTLFFAPFTAASVLNIENITFGLQPSYYFGILFILKETLNFFFKKKFTFAKPNIFFLWFLFFSLISLIFPIIFENKIEVFWQDVGFYPLTLTIHNFTQLFYLIFIFLIYIYSKNFFQQSQNKQNLFKEIINIQIFSIIFVVFWGLLQIAGGYFSFNLPSLFSNRLGVSISNPPVHGFFRMNSVFPEPSMLAFYLASMLGLFLFIPSNFIKIGKPVLLFAIIVGGVLSISSSFLLGLGIICLLLGINFFIFLFRKKRVHKWILKKKTIIQGGIILFIIIIFLIVFGNKLISLVSALFEITIGKLQLQEFSGIERKQQFLFGLDLFKESNFLGVGYGTVRTTDLFSTLLANVGIIGFILFIGLVIKILIDLLKVIKSGNGIIKGYLFFFVTLFIIALVSVPEPYFLFIWINFGIAEALISYFKKSDLSCFYQEDIIIKDYEKD